MKILTLFLCALFCIHTFPAGAPDEEREVQVLMYHSVCDTHNNDYVLHSAKFESDIRYLLDHDYQPVFLNELTAFCEGAPLPAKPVVITFDDGFYNNYSVVLPILRKYGVKAELNVVGSYVEEDGEDRHDGYSYLSCGEIAKLRESGLFEIGNHSYDMHRRGRRPGVAARRGEDPATYERALTADSEKCRKLLRESCGIETHIFALPFGHYSKTTVSVLGKLGYRWVLTCEEGLNRIKRGEEGIRTLRRYNRPNRYSTREFFRHCGMK